MKLLSSNTTAKCLFAITICCFFPLGVSSFAVVQPKTSSFGNKQQHWQRRTKGEILPKCCSKNTALCSSSVSDSSNGGGIINDAVDTIEDPILKRIDRYFVGSLVRVSNHVPAVLSLYYFGLISMASMMTKSNMNAVAGPATLSSVLTRFVGTTSNGEFSGFFPTLVTPSNPVFLVWPVIAVSQVVALSVSSVMAAVGRKPIFDQNDVAALSLSNLLATSWIIVSSRATEGMLPIGSVLILPFVPLLSGYRLRNNKETTKALSDFVFRLFSSFTTIASLLAITVELQHGNRVLPRLFYNKPEVSSLVFLLGYLGIVSRGSSSDGGKNEFVKRAINAVAIVGILAKRIADADGVWKLLASFSFWISGFIAAKATVQLF